MSDNKSLYRVLGGLIEEQFAKVHPSFVPPVVLSKQRIEAKLEKLWEVGKMVGTSKKCSKDATEKFNSNLDKLFDCISCKCEMEGCDSSCAKSCDPPIHILCECDKAARVPKMELPFVLAQREKVGSRGRIVMAGIDFKTSKKLQKTSNNKRLLTEKKDKARAKQLRLDSEASEQSDLSESFMSGDNDNLFFEDEE